MSNGASAFRAPNFSSFRHNERSDMRVMRTIVREMLTAPIVSVEATSSIMRCAVMVGFGVIIVKAVEGKNADENVVLNAMKQVVAEGEFAMETSINVCSVAPWVRFIDSHERMVTKRAAVCLAAM